MGSRSGNQLPSVATHAATTAAVCSEETTRLYNKYSRQLYRYCLARLRSPEEAEDAVQNTFIRVHGALAKGVTPRFEAAWLYKIAHNVCLTRSEINVRRARNEQPTDFAEVELAAPERTDRLDGLEEALASMPKNLRDPILLREWQGLSYAEIADSLDTSVSAVETLIFRARRHLVATLRPLFDLGLLYSSVRVLLARLRGVAATAGPAKVVAGAAAIAIGGAGVSTAVTVAGDKPPHRQSPPAASAPAPVLVRATQTTSHVIRRQAAAQTKTSSVSVLVSKPQSSTVGSVSPVAATPAAAAPTTSAATPSAPPAATTPSSSASAPAATRTVTVTGPTLPVVTLPAPVPQVPTTVELPSVTTPILTTPGVSIELPTTPVAVLPTIQTPTLPVTVSVPALP
jgi:RNA polymerase sigma factor (sigma-70 family)